MISDIKVFLAELFYILSLSLLIFFVMEYFWPSLVLAYVNVNIVLIFWLLIGIFIVVDDRI